MKRATLVILLVFSISWRGLGEGPAVPFKLHHGYLIVVKCSVGDLRDLNGIVDTGVTETVVDTSVVKRLSLATTVDRATFLTQERTVSAVSIPSLQLGPLGTGPLAGIATDLSSLTDQLGIRPDILIGMDVLHRANFLIDYKARELVFATTRSLAHSAHLALDQRFALVESMVMGKRRLLQVDTGFQGLLLYGEETGALARPGQMESRVESLASTLMAVNMRSSDVRIGDWRTSCPAVAVVDAPRESFGFDGVIGPQALHARRIAFDFENSRISWE